jgi:hypothetical protein
MVDSCHTELSVNELHRQENIFKLQSELMSWPEELKSMPPVEHCFAPGSYARTMFIPKGHLIIGKVHRHSHLNIISYGDVSVATFDGVDRFAGHNVFTSLEGVKRVVFANEDTMWTTIHITSETDLEKIEEEVIMPSDDVEFLNQMKTIIDGGLL